MGKERPLPEGLEKGKRDYDTEGGREGELSWDEVFTSRGIYLSRGAGIGGSGGADGRWRLRRKEEKRWKALQGGICSRRWTAEAAIRADGLRRSRSRGGLDESALERQVERRTDRLGWKPDEADDERWKQCWRRQVEESKSRRLLAAS